MTLLVPMSLWELWKVWGIGGGAEEIVPRMSGDRGKSRRRVPDKKRSPARWDGQILPVVNLSTPTSVHADIKPIQISQGHIICMLTHTCHASELSTCGQW